MELDKKTVAVMAAAAAIAAPLVMQFEGSSEKGYRDLVGIPTAGWGHTGKDVVVGKWYSEMQRKGWLQADLTEAGKTVYKCAPPDITVFQRAAYTSFVFNVGPGKKGVKDGFCQLKSGKQSSILRKAWAGDVKGSCNAMLAWNKAGGRVLPGLTRRRKAEAAMCLRTE